jgi:hypothetical protein
LALSNLVAGWVQFDDTTGRAKPVKIRIEGASASRLGAVGVVLGLLLAQAPLAAAKEQAMTAQNAIDRAQIEDLLTRYYYNLGHGSADSFSAFYASDAELVLGKNSYKGKDGIESAYKSAGANAPGRKAYSFNVLLSNPLVVVHGDTATAQLIFTEIIIDTQGAAPRVLTQGREYDHLVKQNGQWRLKKRQIMGAADEPAGWPD